MSWLTLGPLAAILAALAGCPPSTPPAVTARIGVNVTEGPAPLSIVVTGVDSSSVNGDIASFAWDFGGDGTAEGATTEHTFENPGRYSVELTVTDVSGAQSTASVVVRVQGGPVSARIEADPTTGSAPLTVNFDGTGSTATDDVVLDYFWDFDDGTTSSDATPTHVFTVSGTFTVTLRAVSAGGVEDTATATIVVDANAAASLQFDGAQLATLPVDASAALSEFTFEAWVNAESSGGQIVRFGSPSLAIQLSPAANSLRATINDTTVQSYPGNVAGQWVHVALTNDSADAMNLYVDGELVAAGLAAAPLDVARLILGDGFRGRIAVVRFLAEARTAAQIAQDAQRTSLDATSATLGLWMLDDGSGQAVANGAGEDGVLGATNLVESSDPAWSADGP